MVAITAEPGGADEVRARLLEREVPTLDFEIRSDPEHKTLTSFLTGSAPEDNIFVTKDHEWEVSGPYKMIQPALVVQDATSGAVIPECTWSWKTMGHGDGTWDTRVKPTVGDTSKDVMLVTLRPVMSDLLASIQEKRQVKLGSTHDDW